jgi:transcriptional regulator with XRE-family HTH domain
MWEDTIELLLITTAGDDDTARVVPASFERYADADTLLLPAQATTLEQPLALWWGLETTVPWCVLDRQVSELTSRPDNLTSRALADTVTGAQWGSRTVLSSAAGEYRAVLTGHFEVLGSAWWAPQGSGGLSELLGEHGITVKQLAAELKLLPPLALDVWRGQQPLTAEQAATLAALLGQPAARFLDANPALPPAVVHELNRPLRRSQVKKLSVQYDETEHAARLRAAYGVYTLAARDDNRTQPNWTARTDRYFELLLDQ